MVFQTKMLFHPNHHPMRGQSFQSGQKVKRKRPLGDFLAYFAKQSKIV
jgi:hypothetical protein